MAGEIEDAELNLPQTVGKADNFKELYCNHTRLSMTPFDLVMTFGHIFEKSSNTASIMEDVAIRVSPQTFKFLAQNFAAAMATWESQFGAVTVQNKPPEEVLAAIKAAAERLMKKP
jgi:hypothetical protein